jgi:hypothetical protein
VNLHLPDEPVARKDGWRQVVLDGDTPSGVAPAVTDWLWDRWRALAATGLDRAGLEVIVVGYRRELWLWLAGERTWEQWCSGLIGRIARRLPAAVTAS